jgi:hypothetical protein
MVAGLTAPEVATALGKTVGAVKALRHRGLARLTRVLGLRSLHETRNPRHQAEAAVRDQRESPRRIMSRFTHQLTRMSDTALGTGGRVSPPRIG